ncbi:CpaF family protein [Methylophaga sp.]|uniref:CpaF family protein n=1 Tax=Methylophaga sp. TaxID=2024840 RepID=UPI003A910733
MNSKEKLADNYLEPINTYLKSGEVSEIWVNGPDNIWVQPLGGDRFKAPEFFEDEGACATTIKQIAVATGQFCDETKSPIVDAMLWDGTRFNGSLKSVNHTGSVMTFRVNHGREITVQNMLEWGSVTPEIMDYLGKAVRLHRNILISGATNAGKTSFINALTKYIDPMDRLITIEDTAEIKAKLSNWVRHVALKKNGEYLVSMADLIKNTLRESPDRICVGEIRDTDAGVAFMRALNTGHNGCLSTIHANSAWDAVYRISDLLAEGGTPVEYARKQVCSNLQVIVQIEYLQNPGCRRVTQVAEVTREGDTNIIYEYDLLDGKHVVDEKNYAASQVLRDAERYGVNSEITE